MRTAWASFAADGNPRRGVPWPSFTATRACCRSGAPAAGRDELPSAHHCAFWAARLTATPTRKRRRHVQDPFQRDDDGHGLKKSRGRVSPTSGPVAPRSSARAPTTTSRCTISVTTEADVTEGSGGVWERLHYDWSDPGPRCARDHRLQRVGRQVRLHVHALDRASNGSDRRRRRHRPRGQEPKKEGSSRSCSVRSARASSARRSTAASRRSRLATTAAPTHAVHERRSGPASVEASEQARSAPWQWIALLYRRYRGRRRGVLVPSRGRSSDERRQLGRSTGTGARRQANARRP